MLDNISFNISKFNFSSRDNAFLENQMWKNYPLPAKEIADQSRLMMADLAMNAALAVRYEAKAMRGDVGQAINSIMENISMGVGEHHHGFFEVQIGCQASRLNYRPENIGPVRTMFTALEDFTKQFRGSKYRDNSPPGFMGIPDESGLLQVDMEFIITRLRSYLIYMEGLAIGSATLWQDKLSLYLESPDIEGFQVQIVLKNPNKIRK